MYRVKKQLFEGTQVHKIQILDQHLSTIIRIFEDWRYIHILTNTNSCLDGLKQGFITKARRREKKRNSKSNRVRVSVWVRVWIFDVVIFGMSLLLLFYYSEKENVRLTGAGFYSVDSRGCSERCPGPKGAAGCVWAAKMKWSKASRQNPRGRVSC